jgi:hypothetical protein
MVKLCILIIDYFQEFSIGNLGSHQINWAVALKQAVSRTYRLTFPSKIRIFGYP